MIGAGDVHPRVRDVAAVADKVILAATSAGLLRSADGGERWERKILGLGGSAEALAVAGSGLTLAATPLGEQRRDLQAAESRSEDEHALGHRPILSGG